MTKAPADTDQWQNTADFGLIRVDRLPADSTSAAPNQWGDLPTKKAAPFTIVKSLPLPLPPAPSEPAEPHPDLSTENLCFAFFLVPAGSYTALRILAWILRGFWRQA